MILILTLAGFTICLGLAAKGLFCFLNDELVRQGRPKLGFADLWHGQKHISFADEEGTRRFLPAFARFMGLLLLGFGVMALGLHIDKLQTLQH